MPDHQRSARYTETPSWLLLQTSMVAGRLVNDAFAAAGHRGYHYRVLANLDEWGPASQADLGRRSHIHLSDLVATLNELADKGLIDRAPDPADRRRNVITITAEGRRRLPRLDDRLAEAQDELLVPLDATDRAELTRLLKRILTHHTP